MPPWPPRLASGPERDLRLGRDRVDRAGAGAHQARHHASAPPIRARPAAAGTARGSARSRRCRRPRAAAPPSRPRARSCPSSASRRCGRTAEVARVERSEARRAAAVRPARRLHEREQDAGALGGRVLRRSGRSPPSRRPGRPAARPARAACAPRSPSRRCSGSRRGAGRAQRPGVRLGRAQERVVLDAELEPGRRPSPARRPRAAQAPAR